jgi:catechol 2,3-dioxygenase-like lactoylglutathione lyase family enzyme
VKIEIFTYNFRKGSICKSLTGEGHYRKYIIKEVSLTMGKITLAAVSLDSSDFGKLADFYVKLLEGKIVREFGGHGVSVGIPGTDVLLNFLNAEGYTPPVWPEEPGKPQQMEHLDFVVDNLEEAVTRAIELGAKKAPQQFIPEIVVMLDPAGHPFCLIPK